MEAFEVVDNGAGMGEGELRVLCQAHCTSKLASFEDLEALESLGFRGEALHSLRTLSRSLLITSRRPTDPHGLIGEYCVSGDIALRPCAASVGTRVRIAGMFHEYAVRLQDWRREGKRALGRAVRLVQSYAVGFPAVKVRCSTVGPNPSVLVGTSGSGEPACALAEVFGSAIRAKDFTRLPPISLPDGSATFSALVALPSAPRRSTPDRQFFYVNGHPSDQRALQRACNEAYREHGFSTADYPMLVVWVQMDQPGQCDVNLTPDKRAISVFREGEMAAVLKAAIVESVFSRLFAEPKIEGPTRIQSRLTTFVQRATPDVANVDEEEFIDDSTKVPVIAIDERSSALGKTQTSDIPRLDSAYSEPFSSDSQCACIINSTTCALADPVTDSLTRDDLLSMQILGQFNCGFILARLDRDQCDKNKSLLYIIDQHAADERFRLETLERVEQAQVQTLLAPKVFRPAPAEALAIESRLEELIALGFGLEIKGEGAFQLTSVPQMAGVTLGLDGNNIENISL